MSLATRGFDQTHQANLTANHNGSGGVQDATPSKCRYRLVHLRGRPRHRGLRRGAKCWLLRSPSRNAIEIAVPTLESRKKRWSWLSRLGIRKFRQRTISTPLSRR